MSEWEVVIRGPCWLNLHQLEIRPARVCRERGSVVARDVGFRTALAGRVPR
jgi:hypothetical protein